MNTRTAQISLTLAAALLASQNALPATVYQWTDEEGIVHFSDKPPKSNENLDIQEMEYLTNTRNDAGSDEYSIMNQLERMSEWRRQTEDERMARKQLQLEEKRLAQEQHANRYNNLPSRTTYSQPLYYPSAGYFSGHNKWQNHHWGRFSDPGRGSHGGFNGGFKNHTNQITPITSKFGTKF